MSNVVARGTVGLILGYYVAAIAIGITALFAWPTFYVDGESILFAFMSIFGMFMGAGLSLFTFRESWLIFGVTTGPVVGLVSGLISTVIVWIQFASGYETIVRNPTIDILKGSMIGLIAGLIIGLVVGAITNYIFRIPSRYSLDTPSLGSQKKNYVPTGIVRLLVLIVSFLFSLIGIVIGLNYLKRPDFENQRFATQLFIASGAGFVFSIVRALVFNALS